MTTHSRNTDRFIVAYEKIREILSLRYCGTTKEETPKQFKEALDAAQNRGDSLVREQYKFLKSCARLRNFITHEKNQPSGRSLAIPRDEVVEKIETLAERFSHPGTIKKYASLDPITLSSDDSLKDAFPYITEHNFSQIPIYEGSQYKGMLTTNAIARWLSHTFEEDESIMQEKTIIGKVLEFSEPHDAPLFMKAYDRALDAYEAFQSDKSPSAIIVTADGKKSSAIQGILTIYDAHKIKQGEIP